eukprot:evm.model.scf_85EXC.10 EVM.evm.TU.scf_85EXC.10   scf_85EXC:64372-67395(+)
MLRLAGLAVEVALRSRGARSLSAQLAPAAASAAMPPAAPTVHVGGVGASSSVDDVAAVAAGSQVSLDPVALERLRAGKTKAGKASTGSGCEGKVGGRGGGDVDGMMTAAQARAVAFARLLSVVNGRSSLGDGVASAMVRMLNSGRPWALHRRPDDESVLGELIGELEGSMDPGDGGCGLAPAERLVLASGGSASAGVAAVGVHAGKALMDAAAGVAAVTCEAIGADVRSFDADRAEARPLKAAIAVADDLRCLLEGSQMVNPRKGGAGAAPGVASIPMVHGGAKDGLANCYAVARAELAAAAVDPEIPACEGSGGSPALAGAMPGVCKGLLGVAAASASRSKVALERFREASAAAATAEPPAEGGAGGCNGWPDASLFEGLEAKLKEAEQGLASVRGACAAAFGELMASDAVQGVRLSLLVDDCVSCVVRSLAVEALVSVLSLRAQEGPAPKAAVEDVPAKKAGKPGKKAKKGRGVALAKGTHTIRLALEGCIAAREDGNQVDSVTLPWPLPMEEGGHSAVCRWDDALAAFFSPLDPGLAAFSQRVRSMIEENQVRRKPKIPKGTRDFLPDQMRIRETAFEKITSVFKRHGAVSIDTPVFELRETLTGKYGEDSKLIYDLADQGGEVLSLRYDLTVPFARFVALHAVGNIKRYHIGKVYRRDQPQMTRGRFREFFQCDFDIAGDYATMVPDAEVVKVLVEILTELNLGEFEIKLNHRRLLDATMDIAGVPARKFRTVCSSIDKLDKEPWEAVMRELVEDKGLPQKVADRIGEFVCLRGQPMELLETLSAEGHALAGHAESRAALAELRILFDFLTAMGGIGNIVFDLSLARGLDYYSGVIYEAVLKGANVGSIAAGGRYDKLVGMFSGKDVPAVGVSIGIERVFAILEQQIRARAEESGKALQAAETMVLVSSIGSGLQRKRMELCADLWCAGICAEFGFKPNPKMGDQLNYALNKGIPFLVLFGEDELSKGVVKVKDMAERTEDFVEVGGLVAELKARIGAMQSTQ